MYVIKSDFKQKWHIQQSDPELASSFGVSEWDCDLKDCLVHADLPHRIKA